jgi:hypothetical protein
VAELFAHYADGGVAYTVLIPSSHTSTLKIRAFINGWNDRCQPFV